MLVQLTNILHGHGISFYPNTIQIDFEIAAYNAIRHVFPNSVLRGFFFHFGQCTMRKVTDIGLRGFLNDKTDFKNSVQLITTLANIPISFLDESWSFIKSIIPISDNRVFILINYIEETWILPRDSLFSRTVWSHHDDLYIRTNNSLEGFHSKLNRAINKSQPSFYEIIDKLKIFMKCYEVEMIRILSGGIPKPKRRKYVESNNTIVRVIQNFNNGQITLHELMEYLKNAMKLNF
ncbi:hypothetical protein DMUE_1691 [Dictyocoela muelleri]|nr:hypothetical protein DMUE_1691 [Dictyocoela muelleri]